MFLKPRPVLTSAQVKRRGDQVADLILPTAEGKMSLGFFSEEPAMTEKLLRRG